MSFSSEIKEEILNNFAREKSIVDIKAENFGEELSKAATKMELLEEFSEFFDISNLNEDIIKSILKGTFLSSGCIVDPNIDYHFEVTFRTKSCADYFFNLLSLLEFMPKLIKRKKTNVYTIYFKESEQVSYFLSLVGASLSLLKFEQIRVEKDVKNNINRSINCETANLSKTINSSVKQIEAINKIKKAGKFDSLSIKLKETAIIREKYPEESLDKLLMHFNNEKITKSGLKHRLDKIIKIAGDI